MNYNQMLIFSTIITMELVGIAWGISGILDEYTISQGDRPKHIKILLFSSVCLIITIILLTNLMG